MLFAVTSLRMYENGETYYGCDGLFETIEEATAYIEKDMRETLAERSEYATQSEFTIIDCNDSFHWQIEPMAVRHGDNTIADLLWQLYRSQDEDAMISTGYYDPEEDERNGEQDRFTGWWYVNIT